MAKSLQDRLKQRRSSNFVGREQQLELFRQNLRRSLDSEDYYFIFSVHGQGGVGKTTLLKKYRSLAKEADALTAYTNEETKSIPEVLARFAQQLKEQDAELSDFDKRYKVYLQEKKRLEADPEAPKGAWQLGGRLIARSSKRLAKEFIPGSGLLLDGMDADALGDQMGEWASFVKKRLTNKDEVQLLLQPVETLTPLFLEGLGKHAKNHRICLCFDTYEETDLYLDAWLRKLLEGQYGDAPENLLFVIAGREPLNPNAWSDYGDFIATIPLEAFSELEAKTYLERKGITDEAVVDSILGLSGRLPVLLATLAEAAKHATGDLTDPCATAVERFLKWIDDPVQRDLALHAALPRKLNQDIIQCLLPEGADAKALFQWLSTQPFVQKHQGGYWVYHSVVRELMLRHQFQLSRDTWSDLHSRLADLYDARAKQLTIVDMEEQFSNEEWLAYALEMTYHSLCSAFQQKIPSAINKYFTVLVLGKSKDANEWLKLISKASELVENRKNINLLNSGYKALKREEWKESYTRFASLGTRFDLSQNPYFYYTLGLIGKKSGDFKKAIQCFEKAIELKPDFEKTYLNLGIAYTQLGDYKTAQKSYEKALKLNSYLVEATYNLGRVLFLKGDFQKSIEAYEKAIIIGIDDVDTFNNIGVAFKKLGDINSAINYYKKAISVDPSYARAYLNLGNALAEQQKYDASIEAFGKAIEITPQYARAYNNLGLALARKGESKKAEERYKQALYYNPKYVSAYINLGSHYLTAGNIPKSRITFQKGLDIDQNSAELHMNYAHSLLAEQKQEEAMDHYRQSRNDFEDKSQFFQGLAADYTDFNLTQYNIPKTEYFTLIQQLKDEINYTE